MCSIVKLQDNIKKDDLIYKSKCWKTLLPIAF